MGPCERTLKSNGMTHPGMFHQSFFLILPVKTFQKPWNSGIEGRAGGELEAPAPAPAEALHSIKQGWKVWNGMARMGRAWNAPNNWRVETGTSVWMHRASYVDGERWEAVGKPSQCQVFHGERLSFGMGPEERGQDRGREGQSGAGMLEEHPPGSTMRDVGPGLEHAPWKRLVHLTVACWKFPTSAPPQTSLLRAEH